MAMTEHGHIGDGVYVSDDGYQIWLAVNNQENKVVALEPQVFLGLLEKAGRIYNTEGYIGNLRRLADYLEEGEQS